MSSRVILVLLFISWSEIDGTWGAEADDSRPGGRRTIDAAMVARLPYPGTVVPGALAFTPDGTAVTYLESESQSLNRVLWRVDVAPGARPHIVARAPGEGDTEANLSKEEILRRERQRLRETGITQIARAAKADVIVAPLQGDLYLLKGESRLERLTLTQSPELDPQLSPDGTQVAFVRDGEIWVIDVATRAAKQLTWGAGAGLAHGLAEFIAQEELDRASGFWWAPDGSRIAYQETDERPVSLYSIVHQGGDAFSVETHRYPFAGCANAKVRLGVVATEGGETRWLSVAEANDEGYLARVVWENEKSILVQWLARDQGSLRLYRVDVTSGTRELLIEERSDTWINLHDDLRVVDRTGELLWSSERTGFKHLELRDRAGRMIRTLTEGEWPVDQVLMLDSDKREVWFAAGRESPLELQLYRVSLDGGPVERITRAHGTHRVVVAPDRRHFVDTVSNRRQPPITTLCDRKGKVVTTLADAGTDPRLESLALPLPFLTQFKSRDGVTLFGAFYAPRSLPAGERPPLVVIVYGGPHVQVVTESWGERSNATAMTVDLTAQLLAERGFAVWKMDNRGSAHRGHAFEVPLYHHMGAVEVRDQVDGVRFVARSWPDVDCTRVGVTGASYGGYMTLRCLTEAAEVFHAGVSISPVTSWDGYDTAYTERYMGMPQQNSKEYDESSVLTHVDRLQGKLFLIHGMLDENVHFRHTARLTTALITANKPFTLLPLPDERHSTRRELDRQYVAERVVSFFEESLKKAASNGVNEGP
jgi:dipeptidyl-peptidase 4